MNKILWITLGAIALFIGGVTVSKVFWPNVQVVDRTDSTYVDSIAKAYEFKGIVFQQKLDSMQKVVDKKPTIIIKKVIVPVIVRKDSLITVIKDSIQLNTITVDHWNTTTLPAPIIPELKKTQYGADGFVFSKKSNKLTLKLKTKYLLQGESLYVFNGEDLEDPLITYYDYRTLHRRNKFTTSSVYILCVSEDKDITTRFQKLIKNKNKL